MKILILREWPRGTIGWLVSIVSVFGMLALLLVHPLRNRPGHRWIQLYSRSFYIGLFPLIVLLLMAIWRRLSEYGLTEDRYFLLVLTSMDDRNCRLLFVQATTEHQSHSSFVGDWSRCSRSLARGAHTICRYGTS